MSSRSGASEGIYLTLQAGAGAIAFYIECCVLFTLIAIDHENGIWGSFYLFLVLSAPYCISSIASASLFSIISPARAMTIAHGLNGIATLVLVSDFQNQLLLWSILAFKSALRGIATVAEIDYVRTKLEASIFLGTNANMQTARQMGRLTVPIGLIFLSPILLGLTGLSLAGVMYIVGATSCIALNQSKAADKNHRAAPSKSERSERSSATVSKYTSWAFVFSIILLDAAVNAIYPQVAINTGASRTIMAECLILTGIGGIIGASLAKYFGGQQSARTMTSAMVLAAIATPLLVSLAYISQFPIALLYAGLLISGMSLSMVLVIATTCLQTASFGDKKANEGAIRNLLIGIGSVAGPLLAAVLSSKFNYTFAITIIGGLSILTPLIFFGNSLPLFRLKRG